MQQKVGKQLVKHLIKLTLQICCSNRWNSYLCGDYKIHTFTGPGTFTVTSAGNPGGSTFSRLFSSSWRRWWWLASQETHQELEEVEQEDSENQFQALQHGRLVH
jgi:hypothetical protein